jgi:hypothetical protein
MPQPWRDTSRRAVIKTASVPSPIGGLNARDSVAAMPITDALILRNWFPLPYAVAMRKGWKEMAIGLAPGVNATIAVHSPPIGADKPVAFTGGNVYVLAAPGDTFTPAITGMLSDYWQTTMFGNTGGNYLYAVNGFDSPLVYDGVAFTTVLAETPPTGFNIQGVDPKTFIHVAIHQRRLWFVEKDSMQAWYLPPEQLGGIAAVFPVGHLFKFGGFLMAIYTWAVDSGSGMSDKLVFISSKGEIAIFSGLDVADADAWGLEGVYRLGAPVGRRCGCSYGGDLLLLTTDGVVPLSKSFQSTRVNTRDNLTDKVQQTVSALVSRYKDVVGWMMLLFQTENQAWLVVPAQADVGPVRASPRIVTDDTAVQVMVMNTITGAWSQYTNMDIRCVCLFENTPLFITADGRVCRAWVGYYDNVPWNGSIGERIEIEVLTAYNYFQALGQTKRWTLARPIFQSGSIPESAIDLEVDFSVRTPLVTPVPPVPPSVDYLWDDPRSLWNQARWNMENQRFRRWQSVQGMGYAAALHMLVTQNIETLWVATDFVYELGATV